MIPFKIGNWLIDKDTIKWVGDPNIIYKIPIDRLTEPGPQDRKTMYDWLVHMPTKSWLKKEDIYALNTAFVYAMEYFNIDFPKNLSFVDIFIEQERELKV